MMPLFHSAGNLRFSRVVLYSNHPQSRRKRNRQAEDPPACKRYSVLLRALRYCAELKLSTAPGATPVAGDDGKVYGVLVTVTVYVPGFTVALYAPLVFV